MSELDYEDLLRQARQVGPRAGTKQRLRARVLGATALAATTVAATPAAALAGGKTLSVLGSLALGALGGTLVAVPLWFALPAAPRVAKPHAGVTAPSLESPTAAPKAAAIESDHHTALEPSVTTTAAPNTPTLPAPAATGARAAPAPIQSAPPANRHEQLASIERETALLAEAQRALRRGDAQGALAWLDRRDLEFPRGALGEEALGARIVSQCQLGRFEEARRNHARFSSYYAGSPLEARIDTVCRFSGAR